RSLVQGRLVQSSRLLTTMALSSSGAPNRKDNPEAVHECNEIADKPAVREQRYAKEGRPSRYRHDDRRSDHKRRRHDADGCAVCRIVQAFPEGVEALEVEVDPDAAMARVLDQPGKIA